MRHRPRQLPPQPFRRTSAVSRYSSYGGPLNQRLEKHPGESGFYLLPSGPDAFRCTGAPIDAAEKTLDLQYYIFEGDLTGKFILAHLLLAADRGVRVAS